MGQTARSEHSVYIGLDLGTSGCRACAISATSTLLASAQVITSEWDDPAVWWQSVRAVLGQLAELVDFDSVAAIAVDGTSGSVLLANDSGEPMGSALMYNDTRAEQERADISRHSTTNSLNITPSALARALWLVRNQSAPGSSRFILNQADWINGKLRGHFGVSDENNCLKLGYEPVSGHWPDWLAQLDTRLARMLPRVVPPGTSLGPINREIAMSLGMPLDTQIVAGTTDSVAAFLAAGVSRPGEAVTSLGSTLAIKLISPRPVSSNTYGVYSHRLGDRWLAGGASNTGGAVLLKYFSPQQIEALTSQLQPDVPTGTDYYPLLSVGERFPICDASLQPRLTPRPDDDRIFFQGMLEAMARIEAEGYRRLHELGAPMPSHVFTSGGGASNKGWQQIRENILGVPVSVAKHTDAAYGSALLATAVIHS